jgi:uncharacterized iron-regulated membrane protein
MRKLLFNLHLCLALAAGVFVIVLGLTGSIMAFEPEIDHLLHWKTSYVTPNGEPKSLAEIGAAVEQAFPGERISGYLLPNAPNLSYAVGLQRGLVAVNEYTGEILGVREGGMDFLGYVHQLHLRLLLRSRSDPGKKIMSWVGIVIIFLLLSGLYLWWPLMRITIHPGAQSRRFWFDLHNTIGVWSLVFLLVLAVTGVMIGFEQTAVPWFYKVTGSQPSARPSIPALPPSAKPITLDQAMTIARGAIPGAVPFQVNVPGPKGAYQIRSHFPEDLTPGGRSFVVVDQYTGKVLFAEGSRTAPAGSRIVIQNRAIHTGDILGIPSKTVMSLASLAIVAQAISGVVMWWKRPRKRAKKSATGQI